MKHLILGIFFFVEILSVFGQKNDHIWPMGSAGGSSVEFLELDSTREWTPFSLNFNSDPMSINYFTYRRFTFSATNGTYSSNGGSLNCYTNGMQINGPDDQPILGGDTINYNNYWRGSVVQSTGEKLGLNSFQGNIILPIKKNGKEYLYVFNINFNINISETVGIFYSIVDRECDNAKGCVVSKDNKLINTALKDGYLHACRHANGRDWWLVAISDDNTTYYTFLLDNKGVNLVNTQNIGKLNVNYSAGNATFSHKGDKYAVNDGVYWDSIGVISIFDFDRCTGLLSNPFFDTLVIPEASVGQGIAFSPDDRYLYVNNMNDLYQYDMNDLTIPRVHLATYDGFQDPTDWPGIFTTQFGFWGYGPDGRLYNVSGSASSRYMHILDSYVLNNS